ncbi:hypothetical protein J7F01_14885 [Streptomyces sp. ISL-22]|uniref:hypothetical protein n=1 Tax=unclassified Streptomyces TaxID=2593676 RepID=UPI001BEA431A|nr:MULTISPECIES: hypothetical protein [unclassified Streptomyces]MBT2421908.1 hypothetical protein [Streptomyces sp. ISL-24]MBT2433458.1 hypothetical protein [Streptomyces sp. ISL-22]
MVGDTRTPDGITTAFDAQLDGSGNCHGTVGGAESIMVGDRVWTRWDDADLPDAVTALGGGRPEPVDPVDPAADDAEWSAVKLLRGSYMVTDLPSKVPQAAGIAPVCEAGRLLAHAGESSGEVSSGEVVERGGERLRPLTLTYGPIMIRVYVPAAGKPTVRSAEYRVDGGRSLTARFSELGRPVSVSPPAGQSTVASEQVAEVLGRNGF